MREQTGNRFRKHGMAESKLYDAWSSMRKRCEDDTVPCWKNYGGRGITVCDRWKDFTNFYADMGNRPTEQHQLERRDNDGPYSPENCYWATRTQQARNRRNTRRLTINGEEKTLIEWCEEYEADYYVVYSRIRKGWEPIQALTEPVKTKVS